MFRDCCAESDAADLVARRAGNTRESAFDKLLEFALQPAFDDDHTVAEKVFWGDLLHTRGADALRWLMESADGSRKYDAWFLFDWDLEGDGTVTDLFLEEHGEGLTPDERGLIQRLGRAHLRLYEVEQIDRGRGLRLVDLWNGSRLFVIERSTSLQVATWDLVGGRVASDGLGGHLFEGGLYVYPAVAKERVVGEFRRLHRRYQRRFPGHDSAPFFRKHGAVFNHLWLEQVVFPEPPKVTVAEGDPLVFCRAVFETADVEGVRAKIRGHADVRPLEDDRFAWCEQGPEGLRQVGQWSFENGRVVLESTSQTRVARGRAWIEGLVGDVVRHRATALETLDQAMHDLLRPPPSPATGLPEAQQRAIRELYDRHYLLWLDRPDPDLGNRTPRSAAQGRLWRAKLIERLKRLENGGERAALAGGAAYNFEWLWKELGLERPPA